MRGWMWGATGALLLGAAAAAAQTTRGAAGSAGTSRQLAAPATRVTVLATLPPMTAAAEAAEESRTRARADRFRSRILDAARWAPLGDDGCDAGALRTFADDTTLAARSRADSAQAAVGDLEWMVIARGTDAPLATPAGRALLSTLVAWESGATTPNWDVGAGQPSRRAISAGMSGRVRNPQTNVCGLAVPLDTTRVVIPPVTGVALPASPPVPVVVYRGAAALAPVRTRVLAGAPRAGETFATLYSVRVRTVALWGDYAVVSVAHEGERVPGAPPAQTAGGASYLFHRVGGEWRLLAVPRTWA